MQFCHKAMRCLLKMIFWSSWWNVCCKFLKQCILSCMAWCHRKVIVRSSFHYLYECLCKKNLCLWKTVSVERNSQTRRVTYELMIWMVKLCSHTVLIIAFDPLALLSKHYNFLENWYNFISSGKTSVGSVKKYSWVRKIFVH